MGHVTIMAHMFKTQEKSNRLWGTWMGATHGDDIEYVFGSLWNQPNVTDEEKLLSYNVMSYFSMFAKTGYYNLALKCVCLYVRRLRIYFYMQATCGKLDRMAGVLR